MSSREVTTFAMFILYGYLTIGSSSLQGFQPCVFSGKILSRESWYGFLANITFVHSGRLVYKFVYPADTCCAKVLFYSHDQVSKIHDRMNCFQRVSILRDDYDYVLQLTPRFAWSGCHMIHRNGVSYYECEGGRSFISSGALPKTSWHIAISNCAAIHGIDIEFRIEVLGGVNECHGRYKYVTTTTDRPAPVALVTGQPMYHSGTTSTAVEENTCTIKGTLNTTFPYYAYFSNISLRSHGRIKYEFTYPADRLMQTVILFKKENIQSLRHDMSCFDYEGVIPLEDVQHQVLPMSKNADWLGCKVKRDTYSGHVIRCRGERDFKKATELFLAASNCWSKNGIYLNYKITVIGDTGRTCSASMAYPMQILFIFVTVFVIVFNNSPFIHS